MATTKRHKKIGPVDVVLGCVNVGLFAFVFGIPLMLLSWLVPSLLPYVGHWVVYAIYSPLIAALLFTIFWGILDKEPQVREGETSLFMGSVLGGSYLLVSTLIWCFAIYGIPAMAAAKAVEPATPAP